MQAALQAYHHTCVEYHNVERALASQVADIIADFQLPCSLRRMGLTHYFPSGKAEDLKFFAGLDAESIVNAVLDEVRTEVTGGEDAFVSAMHTFARHLMLSRFRETAKAFGEKLLKDGSYMDSLRSYWNDRTVAVEDMPTNDQLRKQLEEAIATDAMDNAE